MGLIGPQTGEHSWVGTKVRDKNGRQREVVKDYNGMERLLTIMFSGGEKHVLVLNNVGKDPRDELAIEWGYNPGMWGYISDNPTF
jgi:hypothetical protein